MVPNFKLTGEELKGNSVLKDLRMFDVKIENPISSLGNVKVLDYQFVHR